MLQYLLAVVYGIVFGVANIIPGVSGGTMLVVFGCYDKVCGALSLDFKEIKKLLAEQKAGKLFVALSFAVQIRKTYALLGLFQKSAKEYIAWYGERNTESVPAEVQAIAEERWAARTAKDWAKSDELRAKLAEMGYAVKDSKTGYELIKN